MRFVATLRAYVDLGLDGIVADDMTVDAAILARRAADGMRELLGDRLIDVTALHAHAGQEVGWVRTSGRLRGAVGVVFGVEGGEVSYSYRGKRWVYRVPRAWWLKNFRLEVIPPRDARPKASAKPRRTP